MPVKLFADLLPEARSLSQHQGVFFFLVFVYGKLILGELCRKRLIELWSQGGQYCVLQEDVHWPVGAVGWILATRGSCGSNDKCLTPHYPLLGPHDTLQGFIPFPVWDLNRQRAFQMSCCLFNVPKTFTVAPLTNLLHHLSTFSLWRFEVEARLCNI
jgi:hypothetical protein